MQAAYEITRNDRGAKNPRTARYALVYARVDTGAAQARERGYRPIVENAYPPGSELRDLLADRCCASGGEGANRYRNIRDRRLARRILRHGKVGPAAPGERRCGRFSGGEYPPSGSDSLA